MIYLNRVLLIAISVSILSSCTVNVIQMGSDKRLSELTTFPDPLERVTSDGELCHRFVFPDVEPPPEFPNIPAEKQQDDEYVLDQLVKYNRDVRKYLKDAERIVMGAYEDYLQSCQ